jgi:hypothetical protein
MKCEVLSHAVLLFFMGKSSEYVDQCMWDDTVEMFVKWTASVIARKR